MTPWELLVALEILFLQILATQSEKINDPSLKPVSPFSAQADAEAINKGLEEPEQAGLQKVNEVWFKRPYDQRVQINTYFHDVLGAGRLENRLRDIYSNAMSDLYRDSVYYSPQGLLGHTLYKILEGLVIEEEAIEEMVCGNDADFKKLVSDYYSQEHSGNTIESKLDGWAGNDPEYKQVLQLCWKGLCQEKKITPEDADKEAKALQAINPDTDAVGFKNKLNELLNKNCEPDMKLIFEKYRQAQKDSGIAEAVAKAFKENKAAVAWNRLVTYIEDTCKLYADLLEKSVSDEGGTDYTKINRIALTRCERDLAGIMKKDEEVAGKGKTFLDRMKSGTDEEKRYHNSILYLCGKA